MVNTVYTYMVFPGGSMVKTPPASEEDLGSIPGLERSPGEGNGSLSSIFAWQIPWTEDPGGRESMGCKRVGHDLVTKQQHVHIYVGTG